MSATHQLLHFWFIEQCRLCAVLAVALVHSHLHRSLQSMLLFVKIHWWVRVKGQINQNHIYLHPRHHLHHGSPVHAALPSGSAASSSGCTSALPPSNLQTRDGADEWQEGRWWATSTWKGVGRDILWYYIPPVNALIVVWPILFKTGLLVLLFYFKLA